MRPLHFSAVIIFLISSFAHAVDYPGPMGLKWGMSPSEVKEISLNKLMLVREMSGGGASFLGLGDFAQIYTGTFAGIETSTIQMEFLGGSLIAVGVGVVNDPRPEVIWSKMNSTMESKYGKPNASSQIEFAKGERQTKWRFSNDTSVSVNLLLTKEGSSVLWAFVQRSVFSPQKE